MPGQKVVLKREQINGLVTWYPVFKRWGERPPNVKPEDFDAPAPLDPKFAYAYSINNARLEEYAEAYKEAVKADDAFAEYRAKADEIAATFSADDTPKPRAGMVLIPEGKLEEFGEAMQALDEEYAETIARRKAFDSETEEIELHFVGLDHVPAVSLSAMEYLKLFIKG